MSILRTWTKSGTASWTLWDRGDELWELKDDVLRHFAVVDRKLNRETMTEELRLLKDSPIPLEALQQEIYGWEVTELVSDPLQKPPQQKKKQSHFPSSKPLPQQRAPQPLPRGPAFLLDNQSNASQSSLPHEQFPEWQSHTGHIEKTPTMKAISKKGATHTPPESSLTQSSHEKPSPLILDSQEEQHSQQSYNLPAELWSSLSQWIPPSALFQPSLHHQAFLELSGTQAGTYPSQKDSEPYSQMRQGQRQYVKQAQPSKPYHQRPSSHKIKASSGPLFV